MSLIQKGLFCLLPFFLLFPAAFSASEQLSKNKLEQVDQYIRAQLKQENVGGGSYAIVYQNQVVKAEGIGYRDLQAKKQATPETIYPVASVAKLLTATAVLQLAEQGKLNIHHPVQTYLPWFQYRDAEKSTHVTLYHLLTHSAGVDRYSADGTIFTNEAQNRFSTESAVRSLKAANMNADPGERGQYCNSCFNTLGLVIEEVSGMAYSDYMHRFVFEPLGMNETWYGHELGKATKPLAKEYSWFFGFQSDRLLNHKAFGKSQDPEGGIYTTALDLSKYVSSMLTGDQTGLLSDPLRLDSFQAGVPSEHTGWTYTYSGFEAGKVGSEPVLYKGGDGIGSAAAVLLAPGQELGVVLIIGESNSEIKKALAQNVMNLLLNQTPAPFDPPQPLFQSIGYVMLGAVALHFATLALLMNRLAAKNWDSKARYWRLLLGMLLLSASAGISFLLFSVRPTQIGFYGYPYDMAVGLIITAFVWLLWGMYHILLSFFGFRNPMRKKENRRLT